VTSDLASALDEKSRLVWIETPTNPLMNLVDIRAAAEAAKAVGALVVVDNTFATPYLQRPLELGADIVVHSTTKYLGGHSDLVGGFACTNDPTIAERLAFLQNSLGAVPGPFDAWLVLRESRAHRRNRSRGLPARSRRDARIALGARRQQALPARPRAPDRSAARRSR